MHVTLKVNIENLERGNYKSNFVFFRNRKITWSVQLKIRYIQVYLKCYEYVILLHYSLQYMHMRALRPYIVVHPIVSNVMAMFHIKQFNIICIAKTDIHIILFEHERIGGSAWNERYALMNHKLDCKYNPLLFCSFKIIFLFSLRSLVFLLQNCNL